MKHNATQALMSLMALALLAAALVPSSAYGADTALLDNIIKQHRANLAQVKTARYDVAQVTQIYSIQDGAIDQIITGTMTLKGDQMRFEFNFTQTGDTQPLNSNEQGVFLVNPDYAAHARPTVGLFKKIAHLADRSLAPEAAGYRDTYDANILNYADGLDSTTRLEDYLEKFRKAWSQASATQEPDGTIVLAWQNDGRDVIRIVLAGNQGFLVKSYRAFHPESAAPVWDFDATVAEFKGEDGARVFLPVSISERRYRSGQEPGSTELVSTKTLTVTGVRLNGTYDDSSFKLESVPVLPDRYNVLMDIRPDRQEAELFVYSNGQWIKENQATARAARGRDIRLPATSIMPRVLGWGGGALILLALALLLFRSRKSV